MSVRSREYARRILFRNRRVYLLLQLLIRACSFSGHKWLSLRRTEYDIAGISRNALLDSLGRNESGSFLIRQPDSRNFASGLISEKCIPTTGIPLMREFLNVFRQHISCKVMSSCSFEIRSSIQLLCPFQTHSLSFCTVRRNKTGLRFSTSRNLLYLVRRRRS